MDDCIRCHRQGSAESKKTIRLREYLSSTHGKELSCVDCHEDIKDITHSWQKAVRIDCQSCHKKENRHDKEGSVACISCHPPHFIFPTNDSRSSLNWRNLGVTCGKCHRLQGKGKGLLAFLKSFQIASHPKQNFAKVVDKNMCVACHQGEAAHGESGPINNQQCNTCHRPMGRYSSELGYIHRGDDWNLNSLNFVAGYINLIGSLLLAVFFVVAIKKGRK
jgi:hypothetical protein